MSFRKPHEFDLPDGCQAVSSVEYTTLPKDAKHDKCFGYRASMACGGMLNGERFDVFLVESNFEFRKKLKETIVQAALLAVKQCAQCDLRLGPLPEGFAVPDDLSGLNLSD